MYSRVTRWSMSEPKLWVSQKPTSAIEKSHEEEQESEDMGDQSPWEGAEGPAC